MDSTIVIPKAQTPSPSRDGRRRTSFASNSPDFEFWMVRNPSFPTPNLLSADELFVDGVLLPLHLVTQNISDPPDPDPEPDPGNHETSPPDLGPKISSSSAAAAAEDSSMPSLSASKRWRDIFKRGDKEKKQEDSKDKEREKEKKKERKCGGGGGGTSSSAELNINIWPFSRSRSAGNACTRPKNVFGASGPTRKVNSAPCSRSNSAGESKPRKWPSSPGRPGVHLGRSSPVWQVRRHSGCRSFEPPVRNVEKGPKKDASEIRRSKPAGAAPSGVAGGGTVKAKVLNLNVPMCTGYRSHLSCRSDENSALGTSNGDGGGGKNRGAGSDGGGGGRGVGVGNVGSGGNLFNLRSLFTKKVY